MNASFTNKVLRSRTAVILGLNLVFCLISEACVLFGGSSYLTVGLAALVFMICQAGILFLQRQEIHPKEWVKEYWFVLIAALLILFRTLITLAQSLSALDIAGAYASLCLKLTIPIFYGIAAMTILMSHKKYSFAKLFAIQAALAGTVFCLIYPMNGIADEPQHMRTAYNLSNILMGIPSDGKTVMMRSDDAAYDLSFPEYDLSDMNAYLEDLSEPLQNSSLVAVTDDMSSSQSLDYARRPRVFDTEWYQYLMPALGMTVGRLLGLNTISMYLLGRFFNLIFYIAAIAIAIHLMPIGKSALYTMSLLPMSIQLAASVSRDVFRITSAVLTVALTLYLFYNKSEEIRYKKTAIAALIISSVSLLPLRTYVYSLIALLPLFVYIDRKKWIPVKVIRIAVIAISLIAIIALGLKYTLFYGPIVEEPVKPLSWITENRYTIQHFINYPLDFVYLCRNTFWQLSPWYTDTMIGSQLGWLNDYVPVVLVRIFGILLIISFFRRSYESETLSVKMRTAMILFSFISILMIIAGMLITWTPITYGAVEGVQGRYFLPILLPILLSFRGNQIIANEKCDIVLICVQFAALVYTMEFMMLRLW